MKTNRMVFWCLAFAVLATRTAAVHGQLTDQPKPLAPGVLTVIQPNIVPSDTFSPLLPVPGLEINKYEPNYTAKAETLQGQASQVVFFRDVWGYEFSTLGLRQIELEFRRPDGSTVNKHFYYMIYRIRNFGTSLTYDVVREQLETEFVKYNLQKNKIDNGQPTAKPQKFRPRFSLEGWEQGDDGQLQHVATLDSFLPQVAKAIQQREDPNLKLHDQVEIQSAEIPLATTDGDPGVWGVAIWQNVDPQLDFISVYVNGITNAYRIDINSEGDQTLRHKALKLNYWRIGDSVEKPKDKIIYGIPYTDKPEEQIAILRRYDLPGPQLHVMLTNPTIDGEFKLVEVEAPVDMETLDSPAVAQLTKGELPESVATALKNLQFEVPDGAQVTQEVPGRSWSMDLAFKGEPRRFIIRFVPQYWEKENKGLRFLRSLDHFWVYR